MELIYRASLMDTLAVRLGDAVTVRCNCYREHEHEVIVCATDGDRRETNTQQRKCRRNFAS